MNKDDLLNILISLMRVKTSRYGPNGVGYVDVPQVSLQREAMREKSELIL